MPAQPEFLDETLRVAEWRPRERDTWRNGPYGTEAFLLPVAVLRALAQPQRTADILFDTELLEWLANDMAARGVDEPVVVVVDARGRVGLADGHHRVVCATRLGMETLPARLIPADRIRAHGVPIWDLIGHILRQL